MEATGTDGLSEGAGEGGGGANSRVDEGLSKWGREGLSRAAVEVFEVVGPGRRKGVRLGSCESVDRDQIQQLLADEIGRETYLVLPGHSKRKEERWLR